MTTQEASALPMKQGFELPSIDETQGQLRAIAAFQQACRQHLIEGTDYGTIPGTDRPTLLKPGAEKLVRLLGLADEYSIESIKDWDKPFFHFEVVCSLRHLASGQVVTTGVGECNSMEARYRWRQAKRRCPECDGETIIKGKQEYGGGWLCFRKQGGCGEKFDDNDPAITSQQAGRILNEDIFSQVNTLLKMAKKRALVDAALSAGRLSDVFTQDLEDTHEEQTQEPAPARPQGQRQGTAQDSQRTTQKSKPGPSKCEVHGRQFAKGPEGRIGHPLGNGQWCWQDEQVEPATEDNQDTVGGPSSLEDLLAELEALGWTWEQFLEDVIGFPWEDFEKAQGTPAIAWKRFQNYLEQQEEASNGS